MWEIRGVAVRREGFKLTVSNVPEKWHQTLKRVGAGLSLLEFSLAIIGLYAAILGSAFSLPIITLLLSLLLFIELGRPDVEIKYNTSFTTPAMTIGPGGRAKFEYDPPIQMIGWNYLDDEENPIPDEELGLHGSQSVELEIPEGNRRALGERGEPFFSVGLPYPVKNIKISSESQEHKYEDLEGEAQIEGPDDLEEALIRDEASLSFQLGHEDLFSLGRIFQTTAADDSKSVELVTTPDHIEFRYSQDTFAHTLQARKDGLDPADSYEVGLSWGPANLNMLIEPVTEIHSDGEK